MYTPNWKLIEAFSPENLELDTRRRLRQMTTGLCSLAPVSEVQHLTDRFQTVVRPDTEMVNEDELSPSLLSST